MDFLCLDESKTIQKEIHIQGGKADKTLKLLESEVLPDVANKNKNPEALTAVKCGDAAAK